MMSFRGHGQVGSKKWERESFCSKLQPPAIRGIAKDVVGGLAWKQRSYFGPPGLTV
jgi:hypothetical protein